MKRIGCLLLLSCTCYTFLTAQVKETNGFTSFYEPNTTEATGFFTESLQRGYHFASLRTFDIAEDFKLELQGTYQRLGAGFLIEPQGLYEFDLFGKYYFTNKLYLFGGPSAGVLYNENTGKAFIQNLGIKYGVGYDISETFFIQVQHGVELKNFNKTQSIAIPGVGLPTIKSGIKF